MTSKYIWQHSACTPICTFVTKNMIWKSKSIFTFHIIPAYMEVLFTATFLLGTMTIMLHHSLPMTSMVNISLLMNLVIITFKSLSSYYKDWKWPEARWLVNWEVKKCKSITKEVGANTLDHLTLVIGLNKSLHTQGHLPTKQYSHQWTFSNVQNK
jgi:hypothetical protein